MLSCRIINNLALSNYGVKILEFLSKSKSGGDDEDDEDDNFFYVIPTI